MFTSFPLSTRLKPLSEADKLLGHNVCLAFDALISLQELKGGWELNLKVEPRASFELATYGSPGLLQGSTGMWFHPSLYQAKLPGHDRTAVPNNMLRNH